MSPVITLAAALLLPLACLAGDDFKPLEVNAGLWETTITTKAKGMPPMPASVMERLTPEQRARTEEAVKSSGTAGQQTRVTKSCLTSDDLKKPFALNDDAHATCKRTVVSSSGTKEDVHFECAKGPVKSVGDIHVEAVSAESMKGTSQATSGDGEHSMDFKVSFAGRWLGADCGPFTKK
jgi:hypothetical protein